MFNLKKSEARSLLEIDSLSSTIDSPIEHQWKLLLLNEHKSEVLIYPFHGYFEKIFFELNTALSSITHAISNEKLRKIIVRDMLEIIYKVIQRPVIWEFTVTNKNREEKITFLNFIENLANPDQLEKFFKKYPVLQEIFLNVINNYLSFQSEFIKRLIDDLKEIEKFFGETKQTLVNFEQLGDSHCKGRRTLLVSLHTNDDLSDKLNFVIYKPRPVVLDRKFQEFLRFINVSLEDNFLRLTKIIDKRDYGWIEFVEHVPIKNGLEKNFYYRLGFLLGVIYSLNGHDIHFENVIAYKDQPILIDLECLFSIPVNDEQLNDQYWPKVYETAIIPSIKENNDMHYDFSALLFNDNQVSPNKIFELNWIDEYNVRVDRKALKIKPSKNNPYYEDTSKINLSPLFYKLDIIKGFESYYQILLQNKEEFIDCIKKLFYGCIKRVIFRATFIYDKLMTESYHPKLLSSKQQYLDFLAQINRLVNTKLYESVFFSETEDFLQGDIPCFFSYVSKTGVLNSDGDTMYYPYLQGAIERCVAKIKLLDEIDLSKQCQFISCSLEENYG